MWKGGLVAPPRGFLPGIVQRSSVVKGLSNIRCPRAYRASSHVSWLFHVSIVTQIGSQRLPGVPSPLPGPWLALVKVGVASSPPSVSQFTTSSLSAFAGQRSTWPRPTGVLRPTRPGARSRRTGRYVPATPNPQPPTHAHTGPDHSPLGETPAVSIRTRGEPSNSLCAREGVVAIPLDVAACPAAAVWDGPSVRSWAGLGCPFGPLLFAR